ncbi:copper amine oxidase N-terminal domain-containing protein [Brevibacillus borstelensis]|uniref:copper amine oxidase N-terminal domain-containing protein n=1 Tax=Brevibacillus borstelensis TaxID=45462 RepID=UPI0030C4F2F7
MRKALISFCLMAILSLPNMVNASDQITPLELIINGKQVEAKAVIVNGGFEYVPARPFLESLGVEFTYDPNTKTLKGTAPYTFSFTADQEIGSLKDKPVLIDVPPKIINNTFMLSKYSINQLFNYSALYNSDSKTITISERTDNKNFDPYASYNHRVALIAEFAKFGKEHLGKTNWIIGSPFITDKINQPVKLPNLTPVTIEYVEPENLQNTFKVYVKSGDKLYAVRMVNAESLKDMLTYTNPYDKKWPNAVYEGIKQGKVAVGMTKEMVLMSVGKPEKINTSMESWGVHEQWIYPTKDKFRSNYIYFRDGIASSIQISQ